MPRLSPQSMARVRRAWLMNGPHDIDCPWTACSGDCTCPRYAEENKTCKVKTYK